MAENACSTPALDEQFLGALREVATLGCKRAATALSQMIGGQQVEIDVPRASVVGSGMVAQLVGGREDPMVAVAFDLHGDLAGKLLLLLHLRDGLELAGTLLGQPASGGELDANERSALCEVGNILCSVCLSAISQASGLRLVPSTPRLAEDVAGVLVDEALGLGSLVDRALVLETRFHAGEGASLAGHLLLLPEIGSLGPLQRALGR